MRGHMWIGTWVCSVVLGCGGRIDLPGEDEFGFVRSSALIHLESELETQVFTVLSSSPGICRNLRTAYQEFSIAYETWSATMDDGDIDSACQQQLDLVELGAEVSRRFMGEGDSLFYLSFWEDDQSTILPEDGTWQIEGDGRGFYGYVSRFSTNPYGAMVSTWSTEECGFDSDAVDEAVVRSTLDSGFMDVDVTGQRRLGGRIEASMVDEQSGELGEVAIKVGASNCEIDVDADHSHFILF